MRVLMLGWEFPPYISGGLGTACYGLTKALSRQGTDVVFVLPRAVDPHQASHVRVIGPHTPRPAHPRPTPEAPPLEVPVEEFEMEEMEHVSFRAVPAQFASPYQRPQMGMTTTTTTWETMGRPVPGPTPAPINPSPATPPSIIGGGAGVDYGGNLLEDVQRYARMCVQLTRGEKFDVIHAHDWMTFPAGLAVAGATGKPLVVHVHSTEFDRSGANIHQAIYDIERRGMHGAMRVICVSYLTRNLVVHRYGVPAGKVEVVYNGIEMDKPVPQEEKIQRTDKIVLFLGRLTMQKGPEYFVAAAKKVLEKYDRVKFVMAGSGDMARRVIELAAEMGIGHKVLFAGFLRGRDVERIFQMADVYVMPSVSEPFGIAPLEAIRHDVPVIISKNSGVSEVLTHALKVDFWDTHEMANKIIAVLRHPPLATTLRQHADFEVRRLTWDGAAHRCRDVYQSVVAEMDPEMA